MFKHLKKLIFPLAENGKRYDLKFFVVECALSKDRATLTNTLIDDHELFCFRVNLRVPWQASLPLRA